MGKHKKKRNRNTKVKKQKEYKKCFFKLLFILFCSQTPKPCLCLERMYA